MISVDQLQEEIVTLATQREWYNDTDVLGSVGSSNNFMNPYVRMPLKELKYSNKYNTTTILIFMQEVIHVLIPESKGSNIRLYLSNNNSLHVDKESREKEPYIIL